ncbi:MAG: sensor histidine kinase [Tannerellaceae bacterium]|jgi:sensor histidine kinase YesM|nr:sensor histidine kinase [Tannerellaceae bacterium]
MNIIKEKWKFIYRIAAWGIALGFPFIAWKRPEEFQWFDYVQYLISILSFIALFYVNHNYLIKRFLLRKQLWRFVLINVIISVALLMFAYHLHHLLPQSDFRHHQEGAPNFQNIWRFIFTGFFFCIFVCAVSVASKMTGSWYIAEDQRKELERSRTQAELQNLKSQLNPHFLFNTLNNIYSMIAISPERAQDAVHELGRLLRYVLYESSEPLVTIAKEIDFVNNYVELMRIRMPRHVELRTEMLASAPMVYIAPLLFIALIENAFKHGISNNQHSFIHIVIKADDKHVHCNISNSYFPKTQSDQSGSGIGIVNLCKRLSLLYPGRHSLQYGLRENAYVSNLDIQLQ